MGRVGLAAGNYSVRVLLEVGQVYIHNAPRAQLDGNWTPGADGDKFCRVRGALKDRLACKCTYIQDLPRRWDGLA